MLESGYVLDYRSVLQWEWYKDANTSRLFRHLVLTVNYEDRKWRGKVIKRGQRVTSYQQLSSELNISIQGIRTAINHLKSTGEITYLGTRENSIITVNNYDSFQCLTHESTDNQQTSNRPSTDHQQQCNTDKESNKDNKDKEIAEIPYSEIKNLYSSICKSYPKMTKLSDSRKKAIHARFAAGYTLDDFKHLFENAESSTFLKGQNGRNWSATFDWLIKDANMAKVLDGNYNDKQQKLSKPEKEYSFDIDEYERTSFYDNMKR